MRLPYYNSDNSFSTLIPINIFIADKPTCNGPAVAPTGNNSVDRGSSLFIPISDLCSTTGLLTGTQLQLTADRLTATEAQPQHGTLSYTDSGGHPGLRYTPAVDYTGPEDITIEAADILNGHSDPATVHIDVRDPAPVCGAATAVQDGNSDGGIPVQLHCSLPNSVPGLGKPTTYTIQNSGALCADGIGLVEPHGCLYTVDANAGTFNFVPDSTFKSTVTLNYGANYSDRWGASILQVHPPLTY